MPESCSRVIERLRQIIRRLVSNDVPGALALAENQANAMYYRLWGDKADRFGFAGLSDAFHRLTQNPSILRDMEEILAAFDRATLASAGQKGTGCCISRISRPMPC